MVKILIEIARTQGIGWTISRGLLLARMKTGLVEIDSPAHDWAEAQSQRISACTNSPCVTPGAQGLKVVGQANSILEGQIEWYSHNPVRCGFPPDWFTDPLCPTRSQSRAYSDRRHWTRIADFGPADIKSVWEPARFGWVFPLVRAYNTTKDERYPEAFWMAVSDWREKNRPQIGVHWKCGQEISFRALTWAFAFYAFRESKSNTYERASSLAQTLGVFGRRIEVHLSYALSQRNNHGISEAAGLFTIGVLLGNGQWATKGATLLRRLADSLIYDDGSFSQHSTNYHRLVLQLYLWCFRLAEVNGIPFPARTVMRIRAAGKWLLQMLDSSTGRVPNLGPNDGTQLFQLTDLDYLDYRPTIQAVGCITEHRKWLPEGPWDEMAGWLGASAAVDSSENRRRRQKCDGMKMFSTGGYAVWRRPHILVLLRCPTEFRHRPTHADLLHVDLWYQGRNLLRDSGTYSYNCEQPWQDYFPSVASHNTVQFDQHDQMPKLSRFLYGRWPRAKVKVEADESVTVMYKDWKGCRHSRRVQVGNRAIVVIDEVSGYRTEAVLRWRLDPGLKWDKIGNTVFSKAAKLSVNASVSCVTEIIEGWESLYYLQKSPIPVLETRLGSGPARITTKIELFEGQPA